MDFNDVLGFVNSSFKDLRNASLIKFLADLRRIFLVPSIYFNYHSCSDAGIFILPAGRNVWIQLVCMGSGNLCTVTPLPSV